jgi:endoglucanase
MTGVALACSLIAASQVGAQPGAVDAATQNAGLGRGVNVLGYDPIWREFDQARFKDRHFRLIKEGGFSTVRVNLHPFRHMGPAPGFEMSAAWFKTLDWIVSEALKNQLNVILDLHEYNTMAADPQANKPRFLAFWRQIASRFHDAPPTLLFELLNEPNRSLTPELWNDYLAEALTILRAQNPTRNVIVGPAFWNAIDHLEELKLPESDRHLIVTVHYYKPMEFTHQGASWAGRQDKLGVEWRGTPEEQAAIASDFQKAQDWSTRHHRPIFLGEFGAYD